MSNLLIINVDEEVMNRWLNALRDAGLAVHENRMDLDKACRHLGEETSYDLVIYQAGNDADNQSLFDCLAESANQAPVLMANANASDNDSHSSATELLEQGMPVGVKDVFHSADLRRLVLIAQRETGHFAVKRQLQTLQQQYSESESRYQNLLDTSEEAIAYIQDGMHMHINPAYRSLFGYVDEEEMLSRPVTELVSANYQAYFKQFLKTAGQINEEHKLEVECLRSNGQGFRAQLHFLPAVFEGEDCIQLQVENLELQQKLRQVSGQDPQTGLYSRHHFMQDLEALFAQRDPQAPEVSLLYILVDGFEEMRNQHGLVASDLILQEISGQLQSQIQANMTLYRFGDHSFTVLVQDDDTQQAKFLAEALIRQINQHSYQLVSGVMPPTLSIGLTSTTTVDTEQVANVFLNHAYQACREIYTNAGNGFLAYENLARQFPDEDEIDAIDDTIHLRELLGYALEHDRFRLVYQPIVSIQGDTSENYAVLLRLLNNDNEEISPRHFLKQAVQYGYIVDIDRWVIRHAIHAIARYRRNNNRLNFFIQLSESAIQEDTLLLWIVDCLREADAKGAWLTFQFNLPDVCDHILAAEKLINGLKKINCNIAINQFEDSSHPRKLLERIAVDVIKLHHSVISDIDTNEDIRQHLVELSRVSHERRIRTVATKIEKPEVLSILWNIGINYIQGFALQEPSATINYESGPA